MRDAPNPASPGKTLAKRCAFFSPQGLMSEDTSGVVGCLELSTDSVCPTENIEFRKCGLKAKHDLSSSAPDIVHKWIFCRPHGEKWLAPVCVPSAHTARVDGVLTGSVLARPIHRLHYAAVPVKRRPGQGRWLGAMCLQCGDWGERRGRNRCAALRAPNGCPTPDDWSARRAEEKNPCVFQHDQAPQIAGLRGGRTHQRCEQLR